MTTDTNPLPTLHGASHDDQGIDHVFGVVPVGSYILWDSSKGHLPEGWQIADGTNGTMDMRDKVPVGAGNTYANRSTGGGLAAVTLTHDHNHDSEAAHTHGPTVGSTSADIGTLAWLASQASGPGSAHTHNAHSSHSFTPTLPPYVALTWIVRMR